MQLNSVLAAPPTVLPNVPTDAGANAGSVDFLNLILGITNVGQLQLETNGDSQHYIIGEPDSDELQETGKKKTSEEQTSILVSSGLIIPDPRTPLPMHLTLTPSLFGGDEGKTVDTASPVEAEAKAPGLTIGADAPEPPPCPTVQTPKTLSFKLELTPLIASNDVEQTAEPVTSKPGETLSIANAAAEHPAELAVSLEAQKPTAATPNGEATRWTERPQVSPFCASSPQDAPVQQRMAPESFAPETATSNPRGIDDEPPVEAATEVHVEPSQQSERQQFSQPEPAPPVTSPRIVRFTSSAVKSDSKPPAAAEPKTETAQDTRELDSQAAPANGNEEPARRTPLSGSRRTVQPVQIGQNDRAATPKLQPKSVRTKTEFRLPQHWIDRETSKPNPTIPEAVAAPANTATLPDSPARLQRPLTLKNLAVTEAKPAELPTSTPKSQKSRGDIREPRVEAAAPQKQLGQSNKDAKRDNSSQGEKHPSADRPAEAWVAEPKASAPPSAQAGMGMAAPVEHASVPVQTGARVEVRPSAKDQPIAAAAPIVQEVKTDTAKPVIREIEIKLPGNEHRSVDLRLIDDRGKVHVEVHTSDPHLAASMRDNVDDLVQKLEHTGYRAENIDARADVSAVSSGAGANTSGNENRQHSGTDQDSTGGQHGGHSGQQQHQQGQGRGNRPRWLEEIVKNFHSSAQEDEKEN